MKQLKGGDCYSVLLTRFSRAADRRGLPSLRSTDAKKEIYKCMKSCCVWSVLILWERSLPLDTFPFPLTIFGNPGGCSIAARHQKHQNIKGSSDLHLRLDIAMMRLYCLNCIAKTYKKMKKGRHNYQTTRLVCSDPDSKTKRYSAYDDLCCTCDHKKSIKHLSTGLGPQYISDHNLVGPLRSSSPGFLMLCSDYISAW